MSISDAVHAPLLPNAPAAAGFSGSDPSPAGVPLSDIPALRSHPGASAKLFLDFTGDTTATWGAYAPGTTPAYDRDGDPTTFSSSELDAIGEIWARVAEAFSPFNLDVTTVDPGNLNDGQTLQVVLGGDGSWFGSPVGGIGYVGGFTNGLPNTVWVFPDNLADGDPKYCALAAAHEAGHGFGLQHQAKWSGGRLISEYNSGNSLVAPIMGNSYGAARAIWSYGPTSLSPSQQQDDLSILAGPTNGFGYRDDESGDAMATASPLTIADNAFAASGIIATNGDVDYYAMTTDGGLVNLKASSATNGAMLNIRMELRGANGSPIRVADTSSLGESITVTLRAGTYYVAIAGHGSYGDVGQYSLSGSISSTGNVPDPPTNPRPSVPTRLRALSLASDRVRLRWTYDHQDAPDFNFQRSTNGRRWTRIQPLPGKGMAVTDTGLRSGTVYFYRVRAVNSAGASDFSNMIRVKTRPAVDESRPRRSAEPSLPLAPGAAGSVIDSWREQSGAAVQTPVSVFAVARTSGRHRETLFESVSSVMKAPSLWPV